MKQQIKSNVMFLFAILFFPIWVIGMIGVIMIGILIGLDQRLMGLLITKQLTPLNDQILAKKAMIDLKVDQYWDAQEERELKHLIKMAPDNYKPQGLHV